MTTISYKFEFFLDGRRHAAWFADLLSADIFEAGLKARGFVYEREEIVCHS